MCLLPTSSCAAHPLCPYAPSSHPQGVFSAAAEAVTHQMQRVAEVVKSATGLTPQEPGKREWPYGRGAGGKGRGCGGGLAAYVC